MDEEDDLQRDERILQREPQQASGGERRAFAGERGEQHAAFAVAIINVDVERVAGDAEFEIEREIERGEWGDVEVLRRDEAEVAFAAALAEEVGLHLAEGVADFDDGAERRARGVRAEVERHGIENVAKHAGQCHQQDTTVGGESDAVLREVGDEVFLRRFGFAAGEREVIAVAECVEVPAVEAEEW